MNTEVYALAERLLSAGLDTMPEHDRRVIERVAHKLAVSRNVNREIEEQLTVGQRLADKVASVGGSWSFISSFGAFLALWALLNGWLLTRPFDPFPFIFLNLMLSMLAAIQAPIIMMSQSRQADRDRLRAIQDYEVNLKAELEIAALAQRVDAIELQQLTRIEAKIDSLLLLR
jgi:uncharacterized membrane protein